MKTSTYTALVVLTTSLFNSNSAKAEYLNLQAPLQGGEHQVGFKLYHEYDHGRSYANVYDENGQLSTAPNPRPMQIAIWYPTANHGKAMPYKEYLYADATKDNFRHLSVDEKKDIEAKFVNQRLFSDMGKADKSYLKTVLEFPTTAIKNAPAKEGKYPLILFVNREYRGIHSNSVLMEYLASHGYVVATTASKDRTKSYQTAMSDEVLIQANIEDIQYVKDFVQQFDYIDKNKTGAIGYFVGSIATPILAHSDQNISAIVNLDSLLNTDFFGKANLEKFKFFNAQHLRTPVLDFWRPFNPDQVDEPSFYNNLKYADAYNYRLGQDFNNVALASHFNVSWVKAGDKTTKEQQHYYDQVYSKVNEYTLSFFDAYLKHDQLAKDRLNQAPGGDAFELVKRKALPAPPTEQQFVKLIQDKGAEHAIGVYHQHQKANPQLQILSASGVLNNHGYDLFNDGKLDEAIKVFAFNISLFPAHAGIQDSLAEAYKAKGDKQRAIAEYKKVLEKKPSQWLKDNTVKMLKELGVDVAA